MISKLAVVSKGAELGEGVEVGPFSIIGDKVKIGKGTKIGAHTVITGWVEIGKNCSIFTGTVIGSPPQDLKYKGQKSYVKIGNENTIREYVTVNPATDKEGETKIGNNNLIMAYSHIAHNCCIGDNAVLANAATLAGYVTIETKATIGGLVAVHQFCRIGKYAIIGGCSKVVQNIIPFSMADGHPAKPYWVNSIGLKRNNFPSEKIKIIEKAFRFLLRSKMNTSQALTKIKEELPATPEITYLIQFIETSERGIAK